MSSFTRSFLNPVCVLNGQHMSVHMSLLWLTATVVNIMNLADNFSIEKLDMCHQLISCYFGVYIMGNYFEIVNLLIRRILPEMSLNAHCRVGV